ncbi:MAG: hypothetical protein J1F38_11075 [Muribaculaceae bacterium]|nr:hypothetical protein [Muribaculaceae bacterium]
MGNKGKRNLFLTLLILEVFVYFGIAMFKNHFDLQVKWWIYIITAFLFIFFLGGYRNFSQAGKEDEKYGPVVK